MPDARTQRAIAAVEAAWPHLATDAFVEQVVLTVLDAIDVEQLKNAAWGEGYAEGRREVDAENDAWYRRGRELGRSQATEGWEREWGVAADAGVYVYPSERAAREAAIRSNFARPLVSRLVGPWEAAEQDEPAPPTEDDIAAALAAETPIELSDLPGTWPADVDPAPAPRQPMMVTTGDTTPDSAAPR